MAVDVNDATRPIQSSLTAELTAELRAIKAKLKSVATDLQGVIATIGAIADMSPQGAAIIQTETPEELHEILEASALGLQLYQAVDATEARENLGLDIQGNTNSSSGFLAMGAAAAGLTFKFGSFASTDDDNQTFAFAEAFDTACMGVWPIGHSAVNNCIPISFHSFTPINFVANRETGVSGSHTIYYMAIGY